MKLADTLIKEREMESKVNVDRPRVANDIPQNERAIGAVGAGDRGVEVETEGVE
jgi:hypothetical protein